MGNLRGTRLGLVGIFFTLLLSALALAEPFDELYEDPGRATLREPYRKIYEVYQSLSPDRRLEVERKLRREFGERVSVLPRALTPEEQKTLQDGIRQRARALQAFLHDLYSPRADKTYLRERLFTPAELARIAELSGDADFMERLQRRALALPYAPDIARDSKGRFTVLEDNVGNIGGLGEIHRMQAALLELVPEYRPLVKNLDPMVFHRKMMERYQRRANPANGLIVFYTDTRGDTNREKEDIALEKIYSSLGAHVVGPRSRKHLAFDEKGAWLEWREGSRTRREPVGFVYTQAQPHHYDLHSAEGYLHSLKGYAEEAILDGDTKARQRDALEAAVASENPEWIREALKGTEWGEMFEKEFRGSRTLKGLTEAVVSGRVASNYTPGGDLLGDKAFYRRVDDMIRIYLKEEPILRSLRTEKLVQSDWNGKPVFRHKFYEEVKAHPERWVIKAVDGLGGSGVTVGAFARKKEFAAALAAAKRAPESYVIQEFMQMSEMESNLVDYRGFGEITWKDVYVGPLFWGRNAPKQGSGGKVNISLGGGSTAIVQALGCREPLAKLRRP